MLHFLSTKTGTSVAFLILFVMLPKKNGMEKHIVQLQSLDKILIVIEAPHHFSMQFQ